MSRGLGRLQKFIKEEIYRNAREFEAECDRLDDVPDDKKFWLTWSEIRYQVWKSRYEISGPIDNGASLDRSAKRALLRLVKRGEVGRISERDGFWYMTKETYEEGFSPKATRELKAALERSGSNR